MKPPAQKSTRRAWFVLGSFPLISAAEISAVLRLDGRFAYTPPILKTETPIDPVELIGRLGGTIKIAIEIADGLTEEELITEIKNELAKLSGKIIFGVSLYAEGVDRRELIDWVEDLGKQIKKEMKADGHSVRYVFNGEPTLSSVTVNKNSLDKKGREFIVIKNGRAWSLAQTAVVQPFEEWGARDYGRPGRDDLSGMLPPKLARMMINLSGADTGDTLLDPFCGSGTILTEALALGFRCLIGSDISDKAVADTEKNVEWLLKNPKIKKQKLDISQNDIRNLAKQLKPNSIDAIVAEPYLGKPLKGRETENELRGQLAELKTLYLAAFEQFTRLLKSGGVAVVIIPRFKTRSSWLTLNLENEIKKLGFTAESLLALNGKNHTSLLYARSEQRVGREIWKFKKN
ncbi:MAG: DNA methyltransferase [Patescibacteria group bacterium]|nr:DNA methyltransferase [Patescibacteria group bacterium]